VKKIIALVTLILITTFTFAQETYTVSGTIKNAAGQGLQSATVFISGSEKITMTDANGRFVFRSISSGTYQLVVNMLSYAPVKQNVIVNDKPEIVDITLTEKQTMLNEVVIGGKKTRDDAHLKTFIKYFMGESANAKACKILNPEILDFSTAKNLLKAATYDFLEIQNDNLGYKVRYLLKSFQYDSSTEVTLYEGESIFEQLDGSPDQQAKWAANRKKAYDGSLMHFLRSVYANNSREEGFMVYLTRNDYFPMSINPNPVVAEQIVKRLDKNFLKFRFTKRLYVLHDKKKAAKPDKLIDDKDWIVSDLPSNGSIFMVDSQVDRRGSYANYNKLLIQGGWGKKRIGDQLPLEYLPE
jgi:hypothetical protein